jgi:hypothetical protein
MLTLNGRPAKPEAATTPSPTCDPSVEPARRDQICWTNAVSLIALASASASTIRVALGARLLAWRSPRGGASEVGPVLWPNLDQRPGDEVDAGGADVSGNVSAIARAVGWVTNSKNRSFTFRKESVVTFTKSWDASG